MKSLFNLKLLLLYFVATHGLAQNEHIYHEVLETNPNSEAIFNLKNTTVYIIPSTDGKMYFDYQVKFENYSNKERKSVLEGITVNAEKFENTITLVSKNITKTPKVAIHYNSNNGLTMTDDFFGFNKSDSLKVFRKSKDSLVKVMNKNPLNSSDWFFKKFKELDKNGKTKRISSKNVKIIRSTFIIKVPPYIPLTIQGTDTQITFGDDIQNEIHLDLKRGFLKAKVLANNNNHIKVKDASCKIETILGGSLIFNNVKNGIIGSLDDVTIDSEFSDIEIGEVGKDNRIKDFNSTYWFYNFTDDFKVFKVNAEYSKLKLFYPVKDFELSAIGHNTIHYIGEHKISMQPNRDGEKFKMMERKPKTKTPSGSIDLDIIHGVLYTSDEFIIQR
ncbi:hypothetical protein [Pontimicrobium sp. IMCC45349]|uniref:hypothetical protein n=1 Tax=Pontimicrobium sp. IMCC45349 TaxID=3391574 RepID=UPI0039A34CF0